ncbi:MAG TPA: LytTR family DNA-binding domain-containing protein [Chitinophagaceae bacterium]|jgi:two-component system LytT family response regulator|nr:LytTR family DNA-binding domain-containing protein [Chitinophagaceae bacterium]
MKTIKAVIAEDEPRNIDILKKILEKHCDDVEVVGTASTVKKAVEVIKQTSPDVLFLDIEMPPGKGFEVLEKFATVNFDVIFITAHEEYALQAIKFAALDYLLKPISISEVQAALKKVNHHRNGQSNELAAILKEYLKDKEQTFSKIVIPSNDGYNVVDLNNIVYCEACDSYTKIHTDEAKVHLISKPLKEYDELLSDKGFYRVHKSYLVNVNHIRKIIKGIGAAVIMSDKTNIPISMRKKDEFFQSLKGVMNI